MKQLNKELDFVLNLSKLQSILARTFESRIGGIGYNEFVILYYLNKSKDKKMRRIDLANQLGLTASGITRLLIPMEKIGYIKREANAADARVSFVMLAPGGKERLKDRMEDVELLLDEAISTENKKKLKELSVVIIEIGRALVY